MNVSFRVRSLGGIDVLPWLAGKEKGSLSQCRKPHCHCPSILMLPKVAHAKNMLDIFLGIE